MKIGNRLVDKNIHITNGLRTVCSIKCEEMIVYDVRGYINISINVELDSYELLFRLYSGTIQ